MKRYIVSNPKILGGKLVISGTRIPVSRILFLLSEGYTLEAIQEEYPHVSLGVLRAVVNELIQNIDHYQHAA